MLERTLVIIKPNAINKNIVGTICSRFEKHGLKIAAMKMSWLSREKAEGFYEQHRERNFYHSVTNFMTSGPIILMCLSGHNAIKTSRDIIGATNPCHANFGTIRRDFGDNVEANAVHGSDSLESAERELKYFFNSDEIYKR
jgi:nucleoside-diphosphate kinase